MNWVHEDVFAAQPPQNPDSVTCLSVRKQLNNSRKHFRENSHWKFVQKQPNSGLG
jgi:hypothetical protein